MSLALASNIALIIIFTLLAGFGDSQGFVHASRGWVNGMPIWRELLKSGLGFGFGIVTFWGSVRFMREVGIFSAEIQTMLWFVAAVIGVAIASGTILQWKPVDQLVAAGVVTGIGFLLFRTNT